MPCSRFHVYKRLPEYFISRLAFCVFSTLTRTLFYIHARQWRWIRIADDGGSNCGDYAHLCSQQYSAGAYLELTPRSSLALSLQLAARRRLLLLTDSPKNVCHHRIRILHFPVPCRSAVVELFWNRQHIAYRSQQSLGPL